MTPADLLLPTFESMLAALSGWLAKAESELPHADAQALLSARLAPDMFPLATQIRFACVQAQEGLYRLRGEEFAPSVAALLEEGRNAGEQPGTIADAQARIAETLALLRELSEGARDVEGDAQIAHALPMGIVFDFTATQYARDWSLAQFYFHVMTAYAILRQSGVSLGKMDYVAHLLAHVRPGTMPQH